MSLTALEREVVGWVAEHEELLVRVTSDLVAFDTTARVGRGEPHDEVDCQEYVAARMRRLGAEVEMWEPTESEAPPSRQIPSGLAWEGFPQLLAVFDGAGGGPRLLLNGHVDVVSAEPRSSWTLDPFRAAVRDGRLYGRGAVDMKGGVAAILVALEALCRRGVPLAGDVVVNTVTDEESTSGGGVATIGHGITADAAVVAEPTGLAVGIACRGSLMPSIHVEGRAGHAAAVQPDWSEGGAVSATEKAAVVLEAVAALRRRWRDDPALRHPLLPPPTVVATTISGGQWPVSYAANCRVDCHLSYLPAQADDDGYGTAVEKEVAEWVAKATADDAWLAEHPPRVEWTLDVPPSEVARDEPVVRVLEGVERDLGRASEVTGTDFWFDGATFKRAGGIPSVAYGPGDVRMAHAVDEYVPVADLVAAAQGLALAVMRFSGLAGR